MGVGVRVRVRAIGHAMRAVRARVGVRVRVRVRAIGHAMRARQARARGSP